MKKTLLSIAIIVALPITANATGPAHDSGNSPVVATAIAPYQTVTPGAHEDEHIASTAYVIGAYNDAIAAVNRVNDDKQNKLFYDDIEDGQGYSNQFMVGSAEFLEALAEGDTENLDVSNLVTEKAVATGILSQRVMVYTTWEDDTANGTTQVPLTTAAQ